MNMVDYSACVFGKNDKLGGVFKFHPKDVALVSIDSLKTVFVFDTGEKLTSKQADLICNRAATIGCRLSGKSHCVHITGDD